MMNNITMAAVRQRLMVADEVYLYKIPPLSNSGGHRAEDWNLAAPLATCSLLVERRDDQLILEFRKTDDPSLVFAQSVIDCSIPPQQQRNEDPPQIRHWIEGTVDSSRYFTLRIVSDKREAVIGFGFRDRDPATDLRESLQFYESSMKREYEATVPKVAEYSIPKLAKGERIHIRTGKEGTGSSKKKDHSKPALPILLKKPPPAPEPSLSTHIDPQDTNGDDDDDDWEGDFVSANPNT